MTQKDVNSLFTAKVAEYLARGYQINAGSMPGSQGEIAKVDLRNDSEIVRILLENKCGFGCDCDYNGFFIISVGRWTEPLRENWDDTIWNNRLEPISEIKLARITNSYFVTPEEARVMVAKRVQRYRANPDRHWRYDPRRKELGEAAKSIALRFIRRQPRMSGCKLADITKAVRVRFFDGSLHYEFTARGRCFTLKASSCS